MSIGDLADQLGMSKSGLFRHFGAKEQLQLAAIEAALAVFEQEVVTPANAAPQGLERLKALMHAWVGYVERDVFPGGCFFSAASADVDARPGAVRDRIAGIGRAAIDAIVTEIDAAKRLRQLRDDTDSKQLAFELHAVAMEANWARQLLDDPSAADAARTAIDAALARVTVTKGNTR